MIRLMAFLLALPATWGGFALWYQVPGGRPMKILALALWTLLSVLLLLTLYRTRMLLLAAAFMLAFGLVGFTVLAVAEAGCCSGGNV